MRCFYSFIAFFIYLSVQAQQPVQYSLYMLNQHQFNPAYAGLDESLSITGVFRKQWVGLSGSPTAQSLTAHMPWYYLSGSIGIAIDNNTLGAEQNTSATLSYAYQKKIGAGIISIGLNGGVAQKKIDGTLLRTPEGTYEGQTFNHNDPNVPMTLQSSMAPIFQAGAYYKNKTLEIGVSANNLTESRLKYILEEETEIKFLRNYFFIFAYKARLNDKFTLKPSIFIKSDIIQTQTDFSAILHYNNNIFGGLSFRGYDEFSIDAIIFMAGMRLNENITLAYAYDYTLSSLQTYNKGSHEIVLNYNLNKILGGPIPSKVIYNPRLL